jgi:hypothetical protein
MSSFATAVGVGLLGVLAGVPARAVIQRRSTSSGSGRAAVTRYRAGHGLRWFAVTLRLAGQGLGWAVAAYLALAFVCLVLAVIDAATGLLPNRITYPAFPVVAGLLLAASLGLGELGRLGRGLLAAASVGGLFLPLALPSPHGVGVGGPLTALTLVGRRETRPPEGRDRHVDSARCAPVRELHPWRAGPATSLWRPCLGVRFLCAGRARWRAGRVGAGLPRRVARR